MYLVKSVDPENWIDRLSIKQDCPDAAINV